MSKTKRRRSRKLSREEVGERVSKRRRRKRTRDSVSWSRAKSNPAGGATAVLMDVGAGFGAFAATRFLTRMATMATASKKPTLARHAGALASLAAFAAAYFGASRIKALAKYETPILLGTAVAALQTVVQTYIPMLAWLVSDVPAGLPAGQVNQQLATGDAGVLDDPSWYTTGDAYDNGRWREVLPGQMETAAPLPRRAAATPQAAAQVDDLLADLDAEAMKSWSFNGAEN